MAGSSDTADSITESVLPSSTSDQPTWDDQLGFEPYVRALASFLLHPQTRGPLAISIEGEWGSGKSSFMLQLEEKLALSGKDSKLGRGAPLIVRFNAWRHEKEDALWAAFAIHFTQEILAQHPFLHRSWCHLRLAVLRFGWRKHWLPALQALLFLLVFAIVATTVPIVAYERGWRSISHISSMLVSRSSDGKVSEPAALTPPKPTVTSEKQSGDQPVTNLDHFSIRLISALIACGGLSGYAVILVLMFERLSPLLTSPLELDLKKYLESPNYKDRVSFIEQFHEDFSKVVATLAGSSTVFVFVDDLDRCEVPRAADLMQALNLMISESRQLIFVLGMDREKVAAGLAVKHEKVLPYLLSLESRSPDPTGDLKVRRGLEYGYEFIEKFVQIPFLVPKPTPPELNQLLKSLSEQREVRPAERSFGQGLREWWFGRHLNAMPTRPALQSPAAERDAVRRRRERIKVLATEDSQTIHEIVLSVGTALGNNPRRLKQFMNLFRLRVFIAAETGLFDHADDALPGQALTLEQLGKFTALLLRWPLLIADLEQDPKLLEKLELFAVAGGEFRLDALVAKWSSDSSLKSLLREGCLTPGGAPSLTMRRWTLSNLKVGTLLQVSPRVRFVRSRPEAPRVDQREAPDNHPPTASDGARIVSGSFQAATGIDGRASTQEDLAGTDPTSGEATPGETHREAGSDPPVTPSEIFAVMPSRFNKDAAKGLKAVYQFDLSGEGGGTWQVIIENERVEVRKGVSRPANMTVSMTAQDYVDMTTGKLNGQVAFMSGKLRISGDMGLALRMQSLFS